ncbi:hypothetical protein FB45DRAFT_1149052 [Roridomyces roridus]|uniref:Uncharacterized protein n=1 Tax=Roridomyces roridus TaxID=1738132 RepID=A0AAD7F6J8_9AGAR|nr:hypothetical protein FB45DRAFT_1149052 [Roridomyces roridus]
MSSAINTTAPVPVNAVPPPLTRTDTVPIDDPEGDAAHDVDFDLSGFFGNERPAPAPNSPTKGKGKQAQRNASPGPSTPPNPLAAYAKRFLAAVQLAEVPPNDKRFDGKAETRNLQREMHQFVQRVAQFYADTEMQRENNSTAFDGLRAQIVGLAVQSPSAVDDAALGGLTQLSERVQGVEVGNAKTAAQLDALYSSVKTLIVRVNALEAPSASPDAIATNGPPLTAAYAMNDRVAQLEAAVQGLKRPHSPDQSTEARAVRHRGDDSTAPTATHVYAAPAPAYVAPAAFPSRRLQLHPRPSTTPPRPPTLLHLLQHRLPLRLPLPSPHAPGPAPAHANAPGPAPAHSNGPGPAPAHANGPGPAPAPAAGNLPPALPPNDPLREIRFGPAGWGKNITAQATTVIKAVVPSAHSVLRGFRARRGPDPQTIIGCFESPEIVAWLIPAFNAARLASTYPAIIASPN